VFVKINGERHYLWRAVDHEGEILESHITKKPNKSVSLAFMKRALQRRRMAEVIVTDGLKSNPAALRRSAMGAMPASTWERTMRPRSRASASGTLLALPKPISRRRPYFWALAIDPLGRFCVHQPNTKQLSGQSFANVSYKVPVERKFEAGVTSLRSKNLLIMVTHVFSSEHQFGNDRRKLEL
jgi:hypothetical protein